MQLRIASLSVALALPGCTRVATPDPADVAPVIPELESPPQPPPVLSGLVVGWQGGCVEADGEEVWCWGADTIEPSEDRPPYEPARVGDQYLPIGVRESCEITDGDITCDTPVAWPHNLRDVADIEKDLDAEGDMREGCGVWPNGLVRYWGRGIGDNEITTQAVIEGAIDVEIHDRGCCVRTESGRVACLNGELLGTHLGKEALSLQLVPDIDEITELELGDDHGCMLDRAGRVRCFGYNGWGQLGVGDSQPHEGLVEVSLPGPATELAAAHGQICAIAAAQVLCWGAYEIHGRPHFGRAEFEFDAIALHAERNTSCATKPDGSLWCWGIPNAPLIIGWYEAEAERAATPSEVPSPWPITEFCSEGIRSGDDFIFIKANRRSTWPIAFHEDDQLARIQDVAGFAVYAGKPCVFGDTAGVRCFEHIHYHDDYITTLLPKLRNVTALAMYEYTVCAVHGGQVSCLSEKQRSWVQIPGLANIRSVVDDDGGRWCALADDGRITCWRGTVAYEKPYEVTAGPYILGERDVVEIDWGWGLLARTKSGALRSGPAIAADEQLEILIDAGVLEVAGAPGFGGGNGHACARVDGDGDGQSERIACFGDDRVGQLGRLGEHVALRPRVIEFSRN